jgi:hypothetical protein
LKNTEPVAVLNLQFPLNENNLSVVEEYALEEHTTQTKQGNKRRGRRDQPTLVCNDSVFQALRLIYAAHQEKRNLAMVLIAKVQ